MTALGRVDIMLRAGETEAGAGESRVARDARTRKAGAMVCARCGKDNAEGLRLCQGCGAELRPPAPRSVGDAGPTVAREPNAAGRSLDDAGPTLAPSDATPTVAGLAAGTVVEGRYRMERPLGSGGMGSVWLAADDRLELPVALKFIHKDLWKSASAYQRFLQEAKTCLKLTHPNLIRVYHFGEWRGLAYLAMEYLEGQTLHAFLERQRRQGTAPQWPWVAAVLQQTLAAVGYAHAQGVIHRDLKPANIMLARKGDGRARVVVMDFGLAKSAAGEGFTLAGAALGTPYYMAPEQRGGAATVDERADVYSLGVIAYEMLAGHVPTGRTEPPSHGCPALPKGVDEWVFRAIEYDPRKRFSSIREMAQELRKIGSEAPPADAKISEALNGAPANAEPGAVEAPPEKGPRSVEAVKQEPAASPKDEGPNGERTLWQGRFSFLYHVPGFVWSGAWLWGWLRLNDLHLWLFQWALARVPEMNPWVVKGAIKADYLNYLFLFLALLALWGVIRRVLQYLSSSVTFTTLRIQIKTGILSRECSQIELRRVTDLSIRETLWGRLCGFSHIRLLTSHPLIPEATLLGVPLGERRVEQITAARSSLR